MTDKQKQSLIKFLFPTKEKRTFLINNVYADLSEVLPSYKLFDRKYFSDEIREREYQNAIFIVQKFLQENRRYLKEMTTMRIKTDFLAVCDELLYGYAFFLSQTNDIYKDIDIFQDKRALTYRNIFILDII